MSDGRVCPSCSKEVDTNATVCKFCNRSLGDASTPSAEANAFSAIKPLEYQFGLGSIGLGDLEQATPGTTSSSSESLGLAGTGLGSLDQTVPATSKPYDQLGPGSSGSGNVEQSVPTSSANSDYQSSPVTDLSPTVPPPIPQEFLQQSTDLQPFKPVRDYKPYSIGDRIPDEELDEPVADEETTADEETSSVEEVTEEPPASRSSVLCLTCGGEYDQAYPECPNCRRNRQVGGTVKKESDYQIKIREKMAGAINVSPGAEDSSNTEPLFPSPVANTPKYNPDEIAAFKEKYKRAYGSSGSGGSASGGEPAAEPLLVALLSGCCFAGLGQIINGQFPKGIILLFVCGIASVCSGGMTTFPVNVLIAIDAYRIASKKKLGREVGPWEWF